MLDRSAIPATVPITSIPLVEPESAILSNGLPAYTLNTGTQDVVKIDLWFNTGAVHGEEPNHTAAVVDLLREGSTSHSAKEIAEALDGKGAFLEVNTFKERASVTLYCLSKFAKELLPLLTEIVLDPVFPEKEVAVYSAKKAQKLETDLEKVSTLASRAFSENLFGTGHSYGRITDVGHWNSLDRGSISDHHSQTFVPSLYRIMVSGNIPSSLVEDLENTFGTIRLKSLKSKVEFPAESTVLKVAVGKEGVVQNAIKMGRPMFSRLHPDYVGLQVLTTVLGGYFGSRLMSNIREDKGYTYGISAGLQSLDKSGYLMISTETGSDVCEAAITEINHELKRLCNDPIEEDELDLVRNYIMGQQLKSVDGPFELSTKWNGLLNFGLTKEDHQSQVNQILSITAKDLNGLANRYLEPEMMMTVIAGKI